MIKTYRRIAYIFTTWGPYAIIGTAILIRFMLDLSHDRPGQHLYSLLLDVILMPILYYFARRLYKKLSSAEYLFAKGEIDEDELLYGYPLMELVAAPAPSMLKNRPAAKKEQYPASINDLKIGYIRHQISEKMKVGVEERIKTAIAFDKDKLTADTNNSDTEELHLAKKMKAVLLGNAEEFEIIPLSSETQVVLDDDQTYWQWKVTPKKGGDFTLELLLSVAINVEGIGVEMKDLDTYSKKIHIQVNPLYSTGKFFEKNWQWMIGSVCGSGILVTVLKLFKVID